jgi:hypothetical protein
LYYHITLSVLLKKESTQWIKLIIEVKLSDVGDYLVTNPLMNQTKALSRIIKERFENELVRFLVNGGKERSGYGDDGEDLLDQPMIGKNCFIKLIRKQ